MSNQPTAFENLPCLFDERGMFVPLSDDDCMRLSEEGLALYNEIAVAYNEVAAVEKRIEQTTKDLRGTVAEMRNAEAEVAKLRRPTHLDLVRETLCAHTAHRI
jgi:hypothetical protein